MHTARGLLLFLLAAALSVSGRNQSGVPVTDPTVIAKCGGCHVADDHGDMQHISWERTTPEGWEAVIKRMVRAGRAVLTPLEARDIVRYLSATHGLAPEEAKPLMYEPERRVHDETGMASETLMEGCAKCHTLARALAWRRSADDWKQFIDAHAAQYHVRSGQEAVEFLTKAAPIDTPEWAAWTARAHSPDLTGRWLIKAHVLGKGQFFGEMHIAAGAGPGEFMTEATLRSVNDGSSILRAGRIALYAGYEWRGRSQGITPTGLAPDSLSSTAREAMWVSPDGLTVQGRWFWGQYQEFGFDVTLLRASGPTLLLANVSALKIGSQTNRIRLIGDHLPPNVNSNGITFGSGVTVRRIISSTETEIDADVDVSSDALPGRRDIALGPSRLPGAIAVYDRVDYVKVTPESSMAAFGNGKYLRGFQQFEAIGFQRGPDGRLHTSDDLELGPVGAVWSMEVFYELDASQHGLVGSVNDQGFFIPAATNPGANYDVWVIATAKEARSKDGDPLVGKGYLVVTIPTYSFEGRTYIRDLDRWIEDGSLKK